MIGYELPKSWITYNLNDIYQEMIGAKSAILSLQAIPYKREWVEGMQYMELKREVAGTSRIEGADFTDRELDEALKETPTQLHTRSQKQAHAAIQTYRWIATLPDDQPITAELILEIHRKIVTGADDDHCPPGKLRGQDENVNFGQPRHRGVNGGVDCEATFNSFVEALKFEYPKHDKIIQALAAHYHLAAMHPFLDGNGRTARALEALLLQRAGLRDTCFIAMSNYYYDEKIQYLTSLSVSGEQVHNITPFLAFALKGIAIQSRRLLEQTRIHVQKELFRNLMRELFDRLKTPRKRVLATRQVSLLELLLDRDSMEIDDLYELVKNYYKELGNPQKAFIRDLNGLIYLKTLKMEREPKDKIILSVRLEWPTEATISTFMERIKALPKAKTRLLSINR
ncbi:MAG: Fic family protein [Dehalococcoidales bacterium]